MKNLYINIKKVILIITLSTTITGFSAEDKIVVKEAKKTALRLHNVKVGNLLTISDTNGVTLYKEEIKKSGEYAKGFDLSALPNGNYFFELEKDVEIKTMPFSISNKKVIFNRDTETIFLKPVAVLKNNTVYVTKLSPNKEMLKVSIYGINKINDSEELLYTENIKGVQAIERAYKLEAGNYKIVFNSNNKDFTKFINN